MKELLKYVTWIHFVAVIIILVISVAVLYFNASSPQMNIYNFGVLIIIIVLGLLFIIKSLEGTQKIVDELEKVKGVKQVKIQFFSSYPLIIVDDLEFELRGSLFGWPMFSEGHYPPGYIPSPRYKIFVKNPGQDKDFFSDALSIDSETKRKFIERYGFKKAERKNNKLAFEGTLERGQLYADKFKLNNTEYDTKENFYNAFIPDYVVLIKKLLKR